MKDTITYHRKEQKEALFSIVIPTWNNLPYLQLCIESIKKHSTFGHQIILFINDGSDGTLQWVENQDFDYIYSPENLGICYALNASRTLVSSSYILYSNDDMYFLPNWDQALYDEIQAIGHNRFMLSATMIEPHGNNPCCVIANYGNDLQSFREQELIADAKNLIRNDWSGSTWPPNVVHISYWDLVGGMSIEYSPGMYSDPDLSRKLWEVGVRIFRGKGNSLVYHFGCKSTGRIKKNRGRDTFLVKWGISPKIFMDNYLKRGEKSVDLLPERELTRIEKIQQIIKRLLSSF